MPSRESVQLSLCAKVCRIYLCYMFPFLLDDVRFQRFPTCIKLAATFHSVQ